MCITKGRAGNWNYKYSKLRNTKLSKVTEETFSVENKNLKSFSEETSNTQEEWVEGTIV